MLRKSMSSALSFRSGDGDKSKLSDGTSVYVMIKDEMFVSWHKLMCSDILFFWHRGNTLKVNINKLCRLKLTIAKPEAGELVYERW